MKFFIDVDNTIIEHSGFYSYETESRTHRTIGKYPEDNQSAISTMYQTSICHDPEIFRRLMASDEVYILTKYPHPEYEFHKQKRVAQILGISREELLQLTDSKGHPKYICVKQDGSKVEDVKSIFKVDNITDYVLIDDYSENLIEWEQFGGIAIKYYNEYNSPNHPTNGLSISNFRIFEYFLDDKEISCLLLNGTNRYKLNMVDELITGKIKNKQKIDNIKLIKEDLEGHLKIDHFPENHKYSYLDFLLEYYNFRNHLDDKYWVKKIEQQINPNNFTTINTLFELPTSAVSNISHDLNINVLQVAVLSMNKKNRPKNMYDVYLTISDSYYVESANDLIIRVCRVLSNLIRHHVNVSDK